MQDDVISRVWMCRDGSKGKRKLGIEVITITDFNNYFLGLGEGVGEALLGDALPSRALSFFSFPGVSLFLSLPKIDKRFSRPMLPNRESGLASFSPGLILGKVLCVLGVDGAEEDGAVVVLVEVRVCPFVLIGVTGATGEVVTGSSDLVCGGVDGVGSADVVGAGTGASVTVSTAGVCVEGPASESTGFDSADLAALSSTIG